MSKTPQPQGQGARARTRQRLLASAMTLVQRGRVPSVAEVALHSGVGRATAYRYFPSRSKLVSAIVGESLAPVRSYEPRATDGRQRVRELLIQTFPQFKEFEPHMRAALQLSLEHESLERAGMLEEEAYHRGFRRQLLRRAAAPLKAELGARRLDRLVKALSLVYGIEPYVVLKDIWGAGNAEVEAIARWMVDALLDAALREPQTARRGNGAVPHRKSAAASADRGRRGPTQNGRAGTGNASRNDRQNSLGRPKHALPPK
jgi:AcrR family transcriptional regulator